MSDSLPVFIQALNGNTSDKDHFREIVQQYGQSLREKWGEDKIWVWDSAAYSEKALARETKTLEKKIGKEKERVEKEVWHFNNQEFYNEEDALKAARKMKKGKFIVATNELDSGKLGDEEALKAYKEQQHAERGFRFLKDPLFFAHSLFLKKESRIVAMVMIMGLALLVYAIAERKLREALEKVDETIPDQRGKPTKK